MFLLVGKFNMIGMLLKIVYDQVQKSYKNIKQSSLTGFITIPL